jgi:hypothetical protein
VLQAAFTALILALADVTGWVESAKARYVCACYDRDRAGDRISIPAGDYRILKLIEHGAITIPGVEPAEMKVGEAGVIDILQHAVTRQSLVNYLHRVLQMWLITGEIGAVITTGEIVGNVVPVAGPFVNGIINSLEGQQGAISWGGYFLKAVGIEYGVVAASVP